MSASSLHNYKLFIFAFLFAVKFLVELCFVIAVRRTVFKACLAPMRYACISAPYFLNSFFLNSFHASVVLSFSYICNFPSRAVLGRAPFRKERV